MLWLKRFDRFSGAYPRRFSRRRPAPSTDRPIILRPGGLGDMVLLTRAAGLLGLDLSQFIWFGERRNVLWTRYLGLSSLAYDDPATLLRGIGRSPCGRVVINTEQTFGLASVFASRLVGTGGVLIGFDSNARADLFDRPVRYEQEQHELECFRRVLEAGGFSGTGGGGLWPLPECTEPNPYAGATIVAFAGRNNPRKALSVRAWEGIFQMARRSSSDLVAVGTAADRAFSERVLRSAGAPPAKNLVGKLSFSEVVDLLRSATRLVSIDSGLIHVADYCNVPTDVIFTGGNPKKWRPLHPDSRVIEADERTLNEQGFAPHSSC